MRVPERISRSKIAVGQCNVNALFPFLMVGDARVDDELILAG